MASARRIGILGCGFMGKSHGRNLVRRPDAQVVALCDGDRSRAEALGRELDVGAAKVFTDADAMLHEAALDALYVCLPPHAHSGQVEAAAARGVHVFIEKPIAPSVSRAAEMVAAIEKAGVVSQVGYQMRFRRSVSALRHQLDDGSAGRPTLLQGRYFCNMTGSDWWRDKQRSGGQLFEQLIHVYDVALYLLGRPVQVSALIDNLCHRDVPGYTIEDTSVALVRFESGALASITGSNCALRGRFIGDWRVVCENVTLDYASTGDWRDRDLAVLYRPDGDSVSAERIDEDGDPGAELTEDFFGAIAQRRATRCPAQAGLLGVRLVSAALESASDQGRPVLL